MKRFLSFFLCLLLVISLSGCSLLSLLLEPGEIPNPEDLYPYEPDEASYGYFYDQLSEDSKAVYRYIYHDSQNAEGTEIILPKTITIDIPKDAGEPEMQQSIMDLVISITQPAIDALLYDHPNIFYVNMGGENSSTFSVPHRKEEGEEGTTVYLRKLVFYLQTKNLLPEHTLAEDVDALTAAVNAFTVTGESRYEKLRSICDQLATSITYDKEAPRSHCAAGALVDGQAVCDGYAKALKLLCNREGIPCVIVAGEAIQNGKSEPHAWNYIQMENGMWYALDLTWDDVGEAAAEQYFLVGAAESDFASSHIPNGKFSEGDHPAFTFPTLSPDHYMPQ